MALVSIVSHVAGAGSGFKVACTSSTAGAALGTSGSSKRIVSGWTFFERAVWATEACIAVATGCALGVPGRVVHSTSVFGTIAVVAVVGTVRNSIIYATDTVVGIMGHVVGELTLCLALAMAVAIVGAYLALTSCASVASCTLAQAC